MSRGRIVGVGLALVLALMPGLGQARPPAPKAGRVYTFYGLRQLEQDPKVTDADKVRQWEAFIARASAQLEYARAAADRWKDAKRLRRVKAAEQAEADPASNPEERLARWAAVLQLQPRGPGADHAKARKAHWRAQETARRVRRAEAVEAGGARKLDRLRTWVWVLAWAPKHPRAKARVRDLQARLLEEARAVDKIAGVDRATKRAAWEDVLAGRPSPRQRREAQARLQALR